MGSWAAHLAGPVSRLNSLFPGPKDRRAVLAGVVSAVGSVENPA
jgi:hypothetical protein